MEGKRQAQRGRPGSGRGYTVREREGGGPRSIAVLASVVHLSVSFLMGSVCRFLASWVLWVSTNAAVGSQAETRMTTYMYTHTHTRNIKSHDCHSVSHFIHAFHDPLAYCGCLLAINPQIALEWHTHTVFYFSFMYFFQWLEFKTDSWSQSNKPVWV